MTTGATSPVVSFDTPTAIYHTNPNASSVFAALRYMDQSDLDPYERALYMHYCCVAGNADHEVTESLRQTAKACNMSLGKASNVRRDLAEAGWLQLHGDPRNPIVFVLYPNADTSSWSEQQAPQSVHDVNTNDDQSVHDVNTPEQDFMPVDEENPPTPPYSNKSKKDLNTSLSLSLEYASRQKQRAKAKAIFEEVKQAIQTLNAAITKSGRAPIEAVDFMARCVVDRGETADDMRAAWERIKAKPNYNHVGAIIRWMRYGDAGGQSDTRLTKDINAPAVTGKVRTQSGYIRRV